MILTFNSDIYSRLLTQYQPRPITTEENEQALAIVEHLMSMPNRSPEISALIDVWVALIEQFEEQNTKTRFQPSFLPLLPLPRHGELILIV